MNSIQTIGDIVGMDPISIRPGYEALFAKCIQTINNSSNVDNALGEKLKLLASDFKKHYNLEDFNIDSSKAYERTYLGKDQSGWEMMLMTWHKGRQSAIHGHPQFAGYNILKGTLLLEIFEEVIGDTKVKLVNSLEITEGNGFFAIGKAGAMNNHIHRISCITDIAYSLHIYSDDARRGVIYTTIQ